MLIYLRNKDIAALVRDAFHREFPNARLGVRTSRNGLISLYAHPSDIKQYGAHCQEIAARYQNAGMHPIPPPLEIRAGK